MKKLLVIVLALLLLLPSCAHETDNTDASSLTSLAQEQIDSYIGEGLMTNLRSLSDAAIFAATDIFAYGSLPCSDDKPAVVRDGRSYLPVESVTIQTYAQLESYLNGCFTPQVVERLLAGSKYIDIDGVLYCDTASFTPSTAISFESRSITAENKTDNGLTLVITAVDLLHGTPVEIRLPAVCKDGNWRIDGTVDIGNAVPAAAAKGE